MAPNFKRHLNHCKGFPSTVKKIAKDMPNWWAKADDKEQEGRALEDRNIIQYSNSSFRIKKLLCRKVISSYTKNFFEPVVLQSVKMIRIPIHLNKKKDVSEAAKGLTQHSYNSERCGKTFAYRFDLKNIDDHQNVNGKSEDAK